MKYISRTLGIMIIIFAIHITVLAQSSPPPPPGHGQSGNQAGGGSAPLGPGTGVLVLMAAAYGASKLMIERRKTARE